MFTFGVKFLVKVFQRIETGGVHCQHLAHAEDENVRFLAGALEGGLEFVGRPEEEDAPRLARWAEPAEEAGCR